MKLYVFVILLLFLSSITSCIKHEVVPAPEPHVKLQAAFLGEINGTEFSFNENLDGYAGSSIVSQSFQVPPPDSSFNIYSFLLSSSVSSRSIQLNMGNVKWSSAITDAPTLERFNAYFNQNLTLPFQLMGNGGVEIIYTDNNGLKWTSKPADGYPKNIMFNVKEQSSDASGDYSKFTCQFNCQLYYMDSVNMDEDTLIVTDAKLQGWFKR
jgi:hypothetical protein